jgi:hypothetical protein
MKAPFPGRVKPSHTGYNSSKSSKRKRLFPVRYQSDVTLYLSRAKSALARTRMASFVKR